MNKSTEFPQKRCDILHRPLKQHSNVDLQFQASIDERKTLQLQTQISFACMSKLAISSGKKCYDSAVRVHCQYHEASFLHL